MSARLLLAVLVMCAAVGIPIGMMYSQSTPDVPDAVPAPAVAPVVHRFALLPADLNASQERPTVSIDGQGRLAMAWASETEDKVRTIFVARSTDNGVTLTPPQPVRKVPVLRFTGKGRGGKEITRVTSALPRLAAVGELTVLGWTEYLGEGKVEYRIAKSTDGGATFSEPITVHSPDAVRPTFTSLTVGPDGTIACAWLDHRAGVQQPYCAVWPAKEPGFRTEMQVFAGPDKQGICPCCDTDVLVSENGTVWVAFRNNVNNTRECAVCRLESKSTEFSAPVPVSSHNWQFNGCPHDGPSLANLNGSLFVGWMDAHTGPMRVSLTRMNADLQPLGSPIPVETTGTQGHPRLRTSADGKSVHVVWDSATGTESAVAHEGHAAPATSGVRTVQYATFTDSPFAPIEPRPIAPRENTIQTHPMIALGQDGVPVAVWTELSEAGKSVVLTRVSGERK